jgi:predicted dehydrogenase
MTINVALAGAGAFGIKHLDAIKLIPDVKVISLVSRELGKTQEVADKYGIAARHHRPGRQPGDPGGRCRHPVHADADARLAERWPAWRPASTCRWRSRCATC